MSYFSYGYGGVSLSVKPSSIEEVKNLVKRAGREKDLHVLDGLNGECFNPFDGINTATDAAALLGEISSIVNGRNDSPQDATWQTWRDILLRHLCEVCLVVHGTLSAQLLTELKRGIPHSITDVSDPLWRQNSPLYEALSRHTAPHSNNFTQAKEYLLKTFPSYHLKMQTSIHGLIDGILSAMLLDPIASLFGGRSTVSMKEVLNEGKIILVGLPALSSREGAIANAIVQFCFCREAKKTKPERNSFLLSDECHETLSEELMGSLAVLREHKISCVLFTQNLGTLNMRLGEKWAENLVELIGTIVFFRQRQAKTRKWASENIGEYEDARASYSRDDAGRQSTSYSDDWIPEVHAAEFKDLAQGECFVTRDGKWWRVRWPLNPVGEKGRVALPRYLRRRLKR